MGSILLGAYLTVVYFALPLTKHPSLIFFVGKENNEHPNNNVKITANNKG